MTEPSALSGVAGFILLGVVLYGIYRFVEWIDPDPWDGDR